MRKKILNHQVGDTGLSALFLVEEGLLFKHYLVFLGFTSNKVDTIFLETRDRETAFEMYESLKKTLK